MLISEYDNRTNDGKITDEVLYKLEETVTRTEFEKQFNKTTRDQLQAQKVSSEVGASYEGISATIKGEASYSEEINDVVERTTEVTVKTDYHKEQSYNRKSKPCRPVTSVRNLYRLLICLPVSVPS